MMRRRRGRLIMRAVMIFIEQLLCRGPVLSTLNMLSFNPYSTVVPAVVVTVRKIKHREIHIANNGLEAPLCPGFSVSLIKWEIPSHLTHGSLGLWEWALKSWGEGRVAWIIRINRHPHLPFSHFTQRPSECRMPFLSLLKNLLCLPH